MNLLPAAADYVLERGWSIIPVNADKRPALPSWEAYQHKRPSPKEFRGWFGTTRRSPAGIAVITGAISRLAVLDIDSLAVERSFAAAFPDLMETRRVRTPGRSGLHLYFQLARGQRVGSRKFAGADLKADGGYVVAPPTVFPTGAYIVERCIDPRPISDDELEQIANWFASQRVGVDASTPRRSDISDPTMPAESASPSSAVRVYQANVDRFSSRNVALFVTACSLRDQGWTHESVTGSLALAHTVQPSPIGEASESDDARQREAARTIRSAFSRAPRPHYTPRPENVTGVAWSDNRARETMMQRDLHEGTAFWRVFDALTISGMAVGEVFSYGEVYTTLRAYGIGRRALNQFLSASAGGSTIVPRLGNSGSLRQTDDLREKVGAPTSSKSGLPTTQLPSPPPPPTSPHAGAGINPDDTSLKRLEDAQVHTTKRSLIQRGRKADPRYAMPSLEGICKALGIRRSPADPITKADVQSPRKYRQALQKAFISRRAGVYSQALLASRLGVSARTIQRYHRGIGVSSQPTFETLTELSISTLDDAIPRVTGSSPYYLQDEYGTRYGARLETAEWLLKRGRRVWLMRRGFNWYWIGTMPAALESALPQSADATPKEAVENTRIRGERIWAVETTRDLIITGDLPPESILPTPIRVEFEHPAPPDDPPAKPPAPQKRTKRFYRKALEAPYHEWAAKKAYQTATGISMINARRLVDLYGVDPVLKACDKLKWLLSKNYPFRKSLAGFLITDTQLQWRKLYPTYRHQMPPFTPIKRKKQEAKQAS